MLLANDPVHAFMPYPPVPVASAATGPLAGLTFAVKDLFDVAGYRTGCGNPVKLAQSPVAQRSAPPVQALLDAGARFVGKSHTEELAWSLYGNNVHFGTPVNPAAPDRLPGGSSSGSASAVGAGLCDIALGSDTGGSVRAPASFCGIHGLRPSHGAISLEACMPLAPGFDTCGFFARDAGMMVRVGEVLLPADRTSATRLLVAEDLMARLPGAARAALAPALAAIVARRGEARPIRFYDRAPQHIYDAFRKVQSREVYDNHGLWYETFRPCLQPAIEGRFVYARALRDDEVATARATLASVAAHVHEVIGDDGLCIAPVLHGPAPRLDADAETLDTYRHEANGFLCIAGIAGLPQVVLPAGMMEGAPIGLSLIGPRGSDRSLLEAAARLAA